VAAAAESRLLKPGGLTTTTVNSGQQWDAPNGWAPLQWVAVEGLQNYGQQKIAMEVTWRFLTNVQHTYDSKQKLVEKYDVAQPAPVAAVGNIHCRTALAGPTASPLRCWI
jgi:alpha,alpha-trehalase